VNLKASPLATNANPGFVVVVTVVVVGVVVVVVVVVLSDWQ
jgi:hypothetical protein